MKISSGKPGAENANNEWDIAKNKHIAYSIASLPLKGFSIPNPPGPIFHRSAMTSERRFRYPDAACFPINGLLKLKGRCIRFF
jgi:hypothetical protein